MDYNILRAVGGAITIIGGIITLYAQYNLNKSPKIIGSTVKKNKVEDVSGVGSAGIEINRVKTETSQIVTEKNEVNNIKEGGKGILINESAPSTEEQTSNSDTQGKIKIDIRNSNFKNINGNAAGIIIEYSDEISEENFETNFENNTVEDIKKGAKGIKVSKKKKEN